MNQHVFVGFGFGPIQAGFFVPEAIRSGTFSRIVIADVDQALVDAVRNNGGKYAMNIAHDDHIEMAQFEGVEIYNTTLADDRKTVQEALQQATEIVTSLPSVDYYTTGGELSVAAQIAHGFQEGDGVPARFVYTAENNNYAAEILERAVQGYQDSESSHFVQYVNTVIGKMSQVVTQEERITKMNLERITPDLDRAFLVEAYDRIYINRNKILGFRMGQDHAY